jgi:hypothetical protein
MAVKNRPNDMVTWYDRQYCWSNSQHTGINQMFVRTPRKMIDTNLQLKVLREKVEHEKMGSRKWEYNFGNHMYTDAGKPSEFARRQFRSSKCFQIPRDNKRRSNFFTGIHPKAEKLDTFACPTRDKLMETTYARQVGLTQPDEVAEETGFRCRNDIAKEEYRDFSSRRTSEASSAREHIRQRSTPTCRYDIEGGFPPPNAKEKFAIATIRRNPGVLPYYMTRQEYIGPVTMHRPTENTQANRQLNRCVSAPEVPGPHGVYGPPRHHSMWRGRDNHEPVGNWMQGSGYW